MDASEVTPPTEPGPRINPPRGARPSKPRVPSGLRSLASVQSALSLIMFAASGLALCGAPAAAWAASCGGHQALASVSPQYLLRMSAADVATAIPLLIASMVVVRRRRTALAWTLLAGLAIAANDVVRWCLGQPDPLLIVGEGALGVGMVVAPLLPSMRASFRTQS